MKFAVIMIVVIWFISGLFGAWMLEDLDREHWKVIARGPITLARAINENPAHIPSQ